MSQALSLNMKLVQCGKLTAWADAWTIRRGFVRASTCRQILGLLEQRKGVWWCLLLLWALECALAYANVGGLNAHNLSGHDSMRAPVYGTLYSRRQRGGGAIRGGDKGAEFMLKYIDRYTQRYTKDTGLFSQL